MIVIAPSAFADDARAVMKGSVKLYLLHSCIKILSSVRIGNVYYVAYVKARKKV